MSVGGWDDGIKLWDVRSGECLKTINENSYGIESIVIAPDGKTIISGGPDGIKLWDMQSGVCFKTLEDQVTDITSIAITPDGKTIISGGGRDGIKLWDVRSGECSYTINNECEVSIDKHGYFKASDEVIKDFIRVSEAPLTQRKLTTEEIKYFRKKGNFLEIGEIIPKPKV